jgi:tRNA(Arg) A34 adenosine deaminase TadA
MTNIVQQSSGIGKEVQQYLNRSEHKFPFGSDEYFARKALELALTSYNEGNYGIGAVVLKVLASGEIQVFHGRNKMVTGENEQKVIGHAETAGIIKVFNRSRPDALYQKQNELTNQLKTGISCYGTLEPCPMCVSVLTNAGAIRSVSTVQDGESHTVQGIVNSNGAANVIGEKYKTQPDIWQMIQRSRGLTFELLQTNDQDLVMLSSAIFTETREEIDQKLANRR